MRPTHLVELLIFDSQRAIFHDRATASHDRFSTVGRTFMHCSISAFPMIFELHTGAIYLVPNKMFTEIGFASDAIGMISVVGLETSIIRLTTCHSRLRSIYNPLHAVPCGAGSKKKDL